MSVRGIMHAASVRYPFIASMTFLRSAIADGRPRRGQSPTGQFSSIRSKHNKANKMLQRPLRIGDVSPSLHSDP